MPRTEYNEIDANAKYDEYAVAKKQLSGLMKVDNYTKGVLSTAAGSTSQSIAEQVRKNTN